ncbi:hypothetical protein CN553_32135, partial [Bacillus cereus]
PYTWYKKGDIVTYKGTKYEMIDSKFESYNENPDVTPKVWKAVNGNQLEGNLKKEDGNNVIVKAWDPYTWYKKGDIATYKGTKYEMIDSKFESYNENPDVTPKVWKAVN